ncbi:MAG: DUF4339 domain-containing protein [Hyphomicrobiaceae bacterium]|nr:DUF4339 domain-containing protein [Hyphomicrobiaceae bacterium]
MTADATQAIGWYVTRDNGEMDGPLSDADMRSAIGRGRIKPEDRVWRDGMDEWVEARRIPNFAEVRKTYLEQEARYMTPRTRGQNVHERPMAGGKAPKQRSSAGRRSSWKNPKPAPAPPPQHEPYSTTGNDEIQLPDFAKKTKEALEQFNAIPQGAIVFFVLGLIITPLLPVFWFIAWRIWANRRK